MRDNTKGRPKKFWRSKYRNQKHGTYAHCFKRYRFDLQVVKCIFTGLVSNPTKHGLYFTSTLSLSIYYYQIK